MRRQIALAVASPIEEVRAIHIRAAEHQADIARCSRLALDAPRGATPGGQKRKRMPSE